MDASTTFWVAVLLLAFLGAVALAFAIARSRRRRVGQPELATRFGPEYERAVSELGSEKAARRELRQRMHRVRKLRIRELTDEQRMRFAQAWTETQARFVDEPTMAVRQSHQLVEDVMRARGYPIESFDQEVADLTVHHANVVQHYRAARALVRGAADKTAGTEDLRQAMVHYRALFADLLQTPVAQVAHVTQRVHA